MTTTTDRLCTPCYWGECQEKREVCGGECVCRCQPRRPVSDSTNTYVRKALAQELRAYALAKSGKYGLPALEVQGLLHAANLVEHGDL